MYHGFSQTWFGLAKNATEGLASPGMIVPATLLLLGGQVMPFALLLSGLWIELGWLTLSVAAMAGVLAYVPRIAGTIRFRQSWAGALLHPVGVMLLVMVQWFALLRSLTGRGATWKGRKYPG
jgi:uncharacterized membrane protein YhhN